MRRIFKSKVSKIALLTLATLTLFGPFSRAFAKNSPFADVESSHWAFNDIDQAYADGVMTGTGYTDSGVRVFSPSDKVTMAQFMTILTRAFYGDEVAADATTGSWYAKNYNVATNHGLFTNVVNNQGDTEVTREIMAQIMFNVLKDKGVGMLSDDNLDFAEQMIPDFDSVSSSNAEAVLTCYFWGVLTGMDANGSFAPKGRVNRAQTAVIYVRLKEAIQEFGGEIPNRPADPSVNPTPNTGTGDDPIRNPSQGETQTPAAAGTLTNGQPVTEENVLALMEEYKNGKMPGEKAQAAGFTSYVDMARYDAYNPVYYSTVLNINGTECAKFAYAFWDDLFESLPARKVTNYEDVRPGDLVHFSGHWAIATVKAFHSGSRIQTQTVGGGSAGEIGWGNVNNILNGGGVLEIYTRYPN